MSVHTVEFYVSFTEWGDVFTWRISEVGEYKGKLHNMLLAHWNKKALILPTQVKTNTNQATYSTYSFLHV